MSEPRLSAPDAALDSAARPARAAAWRRGAVAVLPAAALALWLLGVAGLLAATLEADERRAAWALLEPRLALLVALWLLASLAGGAALHAVWRRHVDLPARLAEQAQALLAGPGAPPLAADEGGTAARALVGAVNALALQRDRLLEQAAERAAEAGRAVAQERNRFAALMADLSHAVVVCSLDGRVVLFNGRARQLFAGDAPLGLGRPVAALLDAAELDGALRAVQRRLAVGEAQPAVAFDSVVRGGRRLRAHLAPVRASAAAGRAADADLHALALDGYVLVIDDPGEAAAGPVAVAAPAVRLAPPAAAPPAAVAAPNVAERPEFYDFDLFARPAAAQAGDERLLTELACTVFDTETTGLDPRGGDEIIQIGAVRIVGGKLRPQDVFDRLVDPRRPLTAENIAVHGIRPAMLAGQPTIRAVLPAFHAFAADTVLVAHNAAFDMRFLQLKEAATGLRFDQPVLDTLLLAAVAQPLQESHALEAVAARLGVPLRGRHSALGDARVTAECFLRLLPLLQAQGVVTLGQALRASRSTALARVAY